jgi:phenylphosphate carboxylase alpha subunit
MPFPYEDCRDFIEDLKNIDEVVEITDEIDWEEEAGAIIRRTHELQCQAAFLTNIKDYPGQRYLGGSLATWKRMALALGLDPQSPISVIIDTFTERSRKRIKPEVVKKGPCQENVISEDKVSLFDLAAPLVHQGDGGRYLGTWSFMVNKDPDSDWNNWGTYRQMIWDRKHLSGILMPRSDGGIIRAKWEKQGKRCPFAIVIGGDPLTMMTGVVPCGVGENESDLAGGLRTKPIKVVKCKTSDMLVPAGAEIIIEGEILPSDKTLEEGPFGEYTGYRCAPRVGRTAFLVKTITHRTNPIITISNMGVPIDDCDITFAAIGRSSFVREWLVKNGIPVRGVFCPPEMTGNAVIVATETPYAGIANRIANLIFGWSGSAFIHMVFVVDSDVDPTDMSQFLHALANKCHPVRSIQVQECGPGHPAAPFMTHQERIWMTFPKVLFDMTWPLQWDKEKDIPSKSSFESIYSEEIKKKVLEKWKTYGFRGGV